MSKRIITALHETRSDKTVANLTTTIKLPKDLHEQLAHRVISEGYGMRGKSSWIKAAIKQFINLKDFEDHVETASVIEGGSYPISLRLDEETIEFLETAILQVRKVFPSLEGVKSNIIRASIYQKLLRK